MRTFVYGSDAEKLISENQQLKHEAKYWKEQCKVAEEKLGKARAYLQIIGEIVGRTLDD